MTKVTCGRCGKDLSDESEGLFHTLEEDETITFLARWCDDCNEWMLYLEGDNITLFNSSDLDMYITEAQSKDIIIIMSMIGCPHGYVHYGNDCVESVEDIDGDIHSLFDALHKKMLQIIVNKFITEKRNEYREKS